MSGRKVYAMRTVAHGALDTTLGEHSKAERRLFVTFRMTEDEMALLSAAAERTGTSVSQVIRGRVFGSWDELSRRVEEIERRLDESA